MTKGSIRELEHKTRMQLEIHSLGKATQMFDRLRKWDSRSHTKNSADRNLRFALIEFDKVQSKLGLSDTVVERASLFYRKAIERNIIRGRTVKSIAAACLYASCRDLETPQVSN